MRIPANAIIAEEKLTRYLLVRRAVDDKSQFLARAGFTQVNPGELRAAIWELAASADAAEDGANEYGVFLRVEGDLIGPVGKLPVVLVWMQRHADGEVHFVTLKPKKEKQA